MPMCLSEYLYFPSQKFFCSHTTESSDLTQGKLSGWQNFFQYGPLYVVYPQYNQRLPRNDNGRSF